MKGGIGPFHFSRTLPLNIFLQSRTYVILSIESILVKYTLRSVKIPLSLKEPATGNQMLCKLERVLFVIVLGGLRVMLRTIFLQCRQTDKQTSKIYIYIKDVMQFCSTRLGIKRCKKKITAADLVPSHVVELTSTAIMNYLGLFHFLRLSWGAWHLRGFNYILLQGLKRFLKLFYHPTLRIIY